MKNLITIIIMLLVGCATTPNRESITPIIESITPTKEMFIGIWESKERFSNSAGTVTKILTTKLVFLENGEIKRYVNVGNTEVFGPNEFTEVVDGKLVKVAYDGNPMTWKLVEKEVHMIFALPKKDYVKTTVFIIKPNGVLSGIALIENGKRKGYTIKDQTTWKKIK